MILLGHIPAVKNRQSNRSEARKARGSQGFKSVDEVEVLHLPIHNSSDSYRTSSGTANSPIHQFTNSPLHQFTLRPIAIGQAQGPPIHQFTHPPIHPSTNSPIHPSTHPPIHPFTHSPIQGVLNATGKILPLKNLFPFIVNQATNSPICSELSGAS